MTIAFYNCHRTITIQQLQYNDHRLPTTIYRLQTNNLNVPMMI